MQKKEVQLGHACMSLGTLLELFDEYERSAELTSRKSVKQTVRPFDELDKVRLDAWQTVAMLIEAKISLCANARSSSQ